MKTIYDAGNCSRPMQFLDSEADTFQETSMNPHDSNPDGPRVDSTTGSAGGKYSGTTASIAEQSKDTSGAVIEEVKSLGNEALNVAEGQADKVKDATTSQMDAFADALRAASDQLSQNQKGPASEMVAHAAAGLESLSRSLQGKTTGGMIETMRQFGRSNPIGFLAGSVLAGVALGRFAAAGASETSTSTESTTPPPRATDPQPRSIKPDMASQNDWGITQ